MDFEREREGRDNSKIFGLNNWKDTGKTRAGVGEMSFWGNVKGLVLDMLGLTCLIRHLHVVTAGGTAGDTSLECRGEN